MDLITTIIVVKDNPSHLSETIESVYSLSAEILIIDIGMNFKLKKQLSTKNKVTVIEIKEEVPYVELVREKVKLLAKSEYILFLDPDEILSPQLTTLLKSSVGVYDYVKMPRKNIIFGKWIKHSRWWPDYQIRFFKKRQVTWPLEIHKQPNVTGKGLIIEPKEENAIVHYNYESIDEYMGKALRYAKAESLHLHKHNHQLTLSETIKKATSEFISRFFGDNGYSDGMRGFTLAFFQMIYPFLVYFYYLESTKYKTTLDEKDLIQRSISFPKQLYKESLYWKEKKTGSTFSEKVIRKLIK